MHTNSAAGGANQDVTLPIKHLHGRRRSQHSGKRTCRKRMCCNLSCDRRSRLESCKMDWFYWFLLYPQPVTPAAFQLFKMRRRLPPASPGEAPPGPWQRAEDGGEGQSREERVEGEVEQSFHPVVAQALQRVDIVL